MIKKDKVPFKTIGFSKLITAYQNKEEHLKQFISDFPSLEAINKQAEEKEFSQEKRTVLVEVLTQQYNNSGIELNQADLVLKNLKKLKLENTYTVTTGHQLVLFTGPLYFTYKIVSAINLAKQVEKNDSSKNIVPVFWMASEDHDFEEISRAHIFSQKFQWKTDQNGAVGEFNISEIKQVLEELLPKLGDSENANQLDEWLNNAYQKENLADATRYLVHQLFKDKGLVIIDGNDRSLKKLFTPVIQDELLNQTTQKNVEKTSQQLAENYKIQAHARNINLFYLGHQKRERIEINDEYYELVNSKERFTRDEILEQLKESPEKFSPNVLLRPLYQETILPNLAYVGGGGELAYWFQLKSNFEAYKVTFPLLMLRNSVLWIPKKLNQKREALKLPFSELFTSHDELVKTVVKGNSSSMNDKEKFSDQTNQLYQELEDKVKAIDQSLVGTVLGEKNKSLKGLENIYGKILKAEKRKQEETVKKLEILKQKLFPNQMLQERYENFIPQYLQYGQSFFDYLFDNLDPLEKDFMVFYEA